jgi:hypothetical protein
MSRFFDEAVLAHAGMNDYSCASVVIVIRVTPTVERADRVSWPYNDHWAWMCDLCEPFVQLVFGPHKSSFSV